MDRSLTQRSAPSAIGQGAALARAMAELSEAQAGVEACLDALDFDPRELETLEERLFAIRALARKHGVLPDELGPCWRTELSAPALRCSIRSASRGMDLLLQRAVAAAEAAYGADDGRGADGGADKRPADELAGAMAAELGPLKLDRAVFEVDPRGRRASPAPTVADTVTFLGRDQPGRTCGTAGQASPRGGELSPIPSRAQGLPDARGSDGLTLIFDEIDRGVGGATADAVGRRLAALSRNTQVLVVTHSPQVAARGAHHWRVEKHVAEGMTTSRVTPLAAPDRVEEIARMLAGDTVTPAARDAARALLGD